MEKNKGNNIEQEEKLSKRLNSLKMSENETQINEKVNDDAVAVQKANDKWDEIYDQFEQQMKRTGETPYQVLS